MKEVIIRETASQFICVNVADNCEICRGSSPEDCINELLQTSNPQEIHLYRRDNIYNYLDTPHKKDVQTIQNYIRGKLNASHELVHKFKVQQIAVELNLGESKVAIYFQKHAMTDYLKGNTNRDSFVYYKNLDPTESILQDR